MQTDRDSQIVSWIGWLGAAGAEHVMRQFAMSRSMAYQRLNSLTHDGLLEHHAVLYGRPGMYTATLAGLRWQGIAHLGVFNVPPGGFEHAWRVAHTAVELEHAMPDWDVVTEREIRAMESEDDELFASVQVGQVGGRAMLHRPDLVLTYQGEIAIPIEVELSIKSASRLAAICRGWTRARHINTVYYLAAPGPARAVQRAVRAAKANDLVKVLALHDIPLLAQEQHTIKNQRPGYDPRRRESHERDYDREIHTTSEAYR
jgi:hypothetical protein